MSQRECGNCAREVPDGAGICMHCTTALAVSLRRVPGLLDDLVVTWSKQDRLRAGGGGGHRAKQSEAPLPVRFDITAVIAALGNELTTWARDLVDRNGWDVADPTPRSPHNSKRGVVFPQSTTAIDLACYAAEWLADHIGQLRMHPAVMEVHRGITSAIAAAENAIDRPEPQLFVGYCVQCSAAVYAPRAATATRCEHCGAYNADLTERWDMALLKLRGYPATASVIAGWVGDVSGVLVNRKLINSWYHRDKLKKVDDDPDTGDPRFRIGEVLDRAARSTPRKAG